MYEEDIEELQEEFWDLQDNFMEIKKENNILNRKINSVKERVNQELLDHLTDGLDNVDGGKLITDLTNILNKE